MERVAYHTPAYFFCFSVIGSAQDFYYKFCLKQLIVGSSLGSIVSIQYIIEYRNFIIKHFKHLLENIHLRVLNRKVIC